MPQLGIPAQKNVENGSTFLVVRVVEEAPLGPHKKAQAPHLTHKEEAGEEEKPAKQEFTTSCQLIAPQSLLSLVVKREEGFFHQRYSEIRIRIGVYIRMAVHVAPLDETLVVPSTLKLSSWLLPLFYILIAIRNGNFRSASALVYPLPSLETNPLISKVMRGQEPRATISPTANKGMGKQEMDYQSSTIKLVRHPCIIIAITNFPILIPLVATDVVAS